MADLEFNTTAGQTIDREMLVAYLNTGTAVSPTWSPMGVRVSSGSMSYDMSKETNTDILGNTYTTMKKPQITQSFDALPLTSDDAAARHLWTLGIHDQNVQALSNQDVMVAHYYQGESTSAFAERYDSCAISISDFGGDGGGVLTMSTEVTFGGKRTLGKATKGVDGVTFA